MARIRDTATIIAPKVMRDEDLPSHSYLVWQSARNSRNLNERSVRNGVPGNLYAGPLSSIVLSLWPQLAPIELQEELKAFRQSIYMYLRSTNNAFCVQRGTGGTKVVWWISAEWNEAKGAVLLSKPVTPTSAEKRLTPQEAGEDRAPSPVTTRRAADQKESTGMTTTAEKPALTWDDIQKRKAEEHRTLVELGYEFIRDSTKGQPITSVELAKALDVNPTTARAIVRELLDAGRIFERSETKDERTLRFGAPARATRAALYYASEPVPPRTQRGVVDGFIAEYNHTGKPLASRGHNELLLLNSLTSTYQTLPELSVRSGVPQGSARAAMHKLVKEGKAQGTRKRRNGNRAVLMYRKVGVKPAPPVVEERVAQPVAVTTTAAKPAQVQTPGRDLDDVKKYGAGLVEDLISKVLEAAPAEDTGRIAELESENAQLRQELAELKESMAAVRRLMGGS